MAYAQNITVIVVQQKELSTHKIDEYFTEEFKEQHTGEKKSTIKMHSELKIVRMV